MAMIKCGECGNQISDQAPSCIKCGAPIVIKAVLSPQPPIQPPSKSKTFITAILCISTAAIFWYIIYRQFYEQPITTSNAAYEAAPSTASSIKPDPVPENNEIVQPAAIPANWEYSSSDDKMRNESTLYATNASKSILTFDFPYQGGSTPSLIFRKGPKFGKDVILTISKGQFLCHSECTVSAKFDNNKIEKFSALEPSDGSANVLFLTPYSRFLNHIKKAKHLTIEAEFYQEGVHQIEFEVEDLKWD